jgi:hypothetical protein
LIFGKRSTQPPHEKREMIDHKNFNFDIFLGWTALYLQSKEISYVDNNSLHPIKETYPVKPVSSTTSCVAKDKMFTRIMSMRLMGHNITRRMCSSSVEGKMKDMLMKDLSASSVKVTVFPSLDEKQQVLSHI